MQISHTTYLQHNKDSLNLFVAVANSGTNNRFMISGNGIIWATIPINNNNEYSGKAITDNNKLGTNPKLNTSHRESVNSPKIVLYFEPSPNFLAAFPSNISITAAINIPDTIITGFSV